MEQVDSEAIHLGGRSDGPVRCGRGQRGASETIALPALALVQTAVPWPRNGQTDVRRGRRHGGFENAHRFAPADWAGPRFVRDPHRLLWLPTAFADSRSSRRL